MAVQPGRGGPRQILLEGAGAGLGRGGADHLGEAFVQPKRGPRRVAPSHQPMGKLMRETEGEDQRIASDLQVDFVALLEGGGFDPEPGQKAPMEGGRGLQADHQPDGPGGGLHMVQRGAHGDGQRREHPVRDGSAGGLDLAGDPALGEGPCLRGAGGGPGGDKQQKNRQERPEPGPEGRRGGRREPGGRIHGGTISGGISGFNKIAMDKRAAGGVEGGRFTLRE